MENGPSGSWWAEGLLFENCNCTAVCPGHIHFSQPCTHEVCRGFWAIRFRAGSVALAGSEADLAGVDAAVLYETPQVMVDGGWKQRVVVSDRAGTDQRDAVAAIVSGRVGGPWAVLARFVSKSLPLLVAPMRIEDRPLRKSVSVAGVLRGTVEAIKGRDRGRPVTFENIYNKIHDSEQVVARGSTRCDDGEIVLDHSGTHGLWSRFRWTGP